MKIKKTTKTTIKRNTARGSYDQAVIFDIIDAVKVGHLAFKLDSTIHSIPMAFWREGDFAYCHCSTDSRLVQLAQSNEEVCVSFAAVDEIVLAKSAFSHSLNYHSVVVYGQFEMLSSQDEKLKLMKEFINSVGTNRWDEIRQPNQQEIDATAILKLSLQESVAKIRKGPPVETNDDKDIKAWAGIKPV